jgi:hypothetical protein
MNPLYAAAREIEAFCRERQWRSTIIGGLAVQRWGEPRQTRDVDLAILTGFGDEGAFVDQLLAHFTARRPDARVFALRHRVLLVGAANGTPLDISLAALPFEERLIERSSPYRFGGDVVLVTCSAEDLIVLKAFADRPQDWLDIQGILVRQGAQLDRARIVEELRPLLELKEDDGPEAALQRLFARHA